MVQSEPQRSNVVPLLVAALVCDVAVVDPSTGKTSLIGVFNSIKVGTFPTKRPMSVYIKLADANGYYEFDVRYIQVDSNQLLAGAKGQLQVKDRLSSPDLHIPFPALPIPLPGRYDFQVWANSVFLGSTSINAVQRT